VLFAHDTLGEAAVAVGVTSFNYAGFVEEALDSVAAQTLPALELVVVDDCSTDGSAERVVAWAQRHRERFTRIRVERTLVNAGLGAARNAAFAAAETAYVMSLDADNRLRPDCCETLLGLVERAGAAFAYSTLESFGGESPPLSAAPFDPAHLVGGNYIDAMALVAKWAWAAAGGYYDRADARGWEDFSLWCRLAELGQFGVWHPEALAEYRVHAGSMTNSVTETAGNKRGLVGFVEGRHPWVRLRSREEEPRGIMR
jgi:glycosyltransferase involved in cell wall biosynthesis